MSSTRAPRKELIASNYARLESIQPVLETFFNIVKNKRDIPSDRVKWYTLYMYNLIGKLNYISKFPILCYIVSCCIMVYMYIIFIHCSYYIKFIHHIIFTMRKFILQNCRAFLIFPIL